MTRLTIDHHFRPSDTELSRIAAQRYARTYGPGPRTTARASLRSRIDALLKARGRRRTTAPVARAARGLS